MTFDLQLMKNFIIRTISGVGFVAIMLAALLTNKYIFGLLYKKYILLPQNFNWKTIL